MFYLIISLGFTLTAILLLLRYEQQQNTKEINKIKETLCMKK